MTDIRKLTAVMIALLLSMNTFLSFGQVSVSIKDMPLKDALAVIEHQSGYSFFYSSLLPDLSTKVSVSAENKSINYLMDRLLEGLDITYSINPDKQITLAPKRKITKDEKVQRIIQGTVRDTGGEPVVGVFVLIADSKVGTTSDINGNFSLKVPDGNVVLDVSCLGYASKKVTVPSSKDKVVITINEDAVALEETVVIGYGTQKKVNLTGAVSTVSANDLKDRSATSLTHMLQGNVPGLNISTSTGRPGNSAGVNIRGINSISSNATPLVLIDGVEGSLDRVNPNDVESISVIKDASSAAIYGARASFGVILVSTRDGKEEKNKATVRYSGRYGWQSPTQSTDFETRGYYSALIADTFWKSYYDVNLTTYTEADYEQLKLRINDKVEDPARPWTVIEERNGTEQYVYYANTDYYHKVFKDVRPKQSHNASLSGKGNGFNYFVSFGYLQEQGVFRQHPDIFNKYNFLSKLTFDINRFTKLKNTTSYYKSDYDYPGYQGSNNAFGNAYSGAFAFYPEYNPDGSSLMYTSIVTNYPLMGGLNAVLDKDANKNINKNTEFANTSELIMTPLKGFELIANFTYRFRHGLTRERRTDAQYSKYPGQIATYDSGISFADYLTELTTNSNYYTANIFGTFEKSLKEAHNFKVMAGFNYETADYKSVSATGYNIMSEKLNDLNLVGSNAKGEKQMEVSGGFNDYALEGLFARFNYDYKGRYLFETNGRYDGTSRFAKGHRWGFFPSVSVGWRISEEPFFDMVKDWFNNFKVRYSYGSLGNQQVGYYDYMRKINISEQNILFGGSTKPTAATISNPVSGDLTWEKAIHKNLGLDLAFFGNRLGMTAEIYERDTKDMLTAGIALPATYGASSPTMNAADLQTKGYELSLSWRDMFQLVGKPFSYNITANFSDYKTVITKFDNPNKSLASSYYEGMTLGEIWGFHIDGLFSSDEEAKNYDVNQIAVNRMISTARGSNNGLKAGDLKYADLDGDKKISWGDDTVENSGDRRIIGNSEPRYLYGLNLGFQWMGFDFSILFQGVGKRNWYPETDNYIFWGPYNRPFTSFVPYDYMKMVWSEDNPNAYFPRPRGYSAYLSRDNNGYARELATVNDRYLQDIGYLRLKNLSVGYTIPKKILEYIGISDVRIYFTGENLAYWSKMVDCMEKYIDPELAAVQGLDSKIYPWQKTYMFGIDIAF